MRTVSPPELRAAFPLRRWLLGRCAPALALAASFVSLPAQNRRSPGPPPGCAVEKSGYLCDWQTFLPQFERARTVWVEEAPADTNYMGIVKRLEAMGKTPVAALKPGADLIVAVLQSPNSGINIGPADRVLGTLMVYRTEGDKPGGTLIWQETFSGQPDRPWGSVVTALLDQFQERLRKSRR